MLRWNGLEIGTIGQRKYRILQQQRETIPANHPLIFSFVHVTGLTWMTCSTFYLEDNDLCDGIPCRSPLFCRHNIRESSIHIWVMKGPASILFSFRLSPKKCTQYDRLVEVQVELG